MDKSGRGPWWSGYSEQPGVATAEDEANSVAKENSGLVPEKLNESLNLKCECRLKKIRGRVKGGENAAGGREQKCKARPSQRVQSHTDGWRRGTENAFYVDLRGAC